MRLNIPYLSLLMTRLLLTLLALLTGFIAQTAPAEARACEVSGAQVGMLEAPLAAVRESVQGQGNSGPRARREWAGMERSCRKAPRPTVYLPTVQLGPDRARE